MIRRIPIFAALLMVVGLPIDAASRVAPPHDADVETALPFPARGLASRSTWLAPADAVPTGDLLVRARVRVGKRTDLAVLVRVSGEGAPSAGIGVRLTGGTATFVRAKKGRLRAIGAREWVPKVRKRRGKKKRSDRVLEVVLFAHAGHVIAHVFDAGTGRRLGAWSARDIPIGGTVGVRTGRKHRRRRAIELLTARPLCTPLPERVEGAQWVIASIPADAPIDEIGGDRPLEPDSSNDGHRLVRTDLVGLERMICAGAAPARVDARIPFKYVDPGYLEQGRGRPLVRSGRTVLDLSYKDPAMVEAHLRSWHRRFPDATRLERIGESLGGRPIWALALGRDLEEDDRRPSVLLVGAHHGSEPLSTEVVLDAISELLESSSNGADALADQVVWAVPMLNPDGAHVFFERSRRTGRKNGRDHDGDGTRERFEGVDINRNYPFRWGVHGEHGSRSTSHSAWYRGESAASEPETRAIMALSRRERFAAAISYHTGTVAILSPYTIEGVDNSEPDVAWSIAEHIAAGLGTHPHGRKFEVRRNLYRVDGTDQDWHLHTHGTMAFLVEAARWTPLERAERNRIIGLVRPTWQRLLARYLAGPTLCGRVVDAAGQPVEAVVSIDEIENRADERWTSRPRDGRFDRFVPSRGTWTLRVTADDGRSAVRRVHLSAERRCMEIRISP